jgi:sulfite exporter TauE/SafE
MTVVSLLIVGFLLGMKHATESDHVAAVATLTPGRHSLFTGIRLGIAWGVGHTTTLLLVGAVVLALGTAVPQRMERTLEFVVGVMLMLLGTDVIDRAVRGRGQCATQSEVACVHHPVQRLPVRALAIGMVHGLAGSAALILLSLQTVRSISMGIAYIFVFGLGSIAGMALLSLAIAVPLQLSSAHSRRLHAAAMVCIGIATVLLGACTVYRIGVVERLLM